MPSLRNAVAFCFHHIILRPSRLLLYQRVDFITRLMHVAKDAFKDTNAFMFG